MNKLKKIREDAGLTQQELCEKAGILLTSLKKYETDKRDINNIKVGTVFRIASVLGCKIEDIIDTEKALNVSETEKIPKKWEVKGSLNDHIIMGDTLNDAVQNNILELIRNASPDNEHIITYPEKLELYYDEGILGGTGGIVAVARCHISNNYTKDSEYYKESDQIYEIWIRGTEEDLSE